MQPKPWRYKTAYALFAVVLVFLTWRTITGIGDWAWNSALGADTPTVSVDPKPTHDTGGYQWPH